MNGNVRAAKLTTMGRKLREAALGAEGVYLFLMLACVITWTLDVPMVLATLRHTAPSPLVMAGVGLGALGPTLAALLIAGRRRELRAVFGRWRTNWIWIVVGLSTMAAIHAPATLVELGLGGQPAHWFYPPTQPEHVAALVMFSVGEEFGWRGFAYPRLVRRFGPVIGCMVLGTVWGVWHLGMWFTPVGPPTVGTVALGVCEMIMGSLVFAWVFERADRSMAVAIALHMGAHLDNTFRAPDVEVRLRVLRFVFFMIAAVVAARALSLRSPAADRSPSTS